MSTDAARTRKGTGGLVLLFLTVLACHHAPQLLPETLAEESANGPYALVMGRARADVDRTLEESHGGVCARDSATASHTLTLSTALRLPREEYQLPVPLGRHLNPDSAAAFVKLGLVDRLCPPGDSGLCEDSTARMNLSLSETREVGSTFTGVTLLLTRPYYCLGDGMLFAAEIEYLLEPDSTRGWILQSTSTRMVN